MSKFKIDNYNITVDVISQNIFDFKWLPNNAFISKVEILVGKTAASYGATSIPRPFVSLQTQPIIVGLVKTKLMFSQ